MYILYLDPVTTKDDKSEMIFIFLFSFAIVVLLVVGILFLCWLLIERRRNRNNPPLDDALHQRVTTMDNSSFVYGSELQGRGYPTVQDIFIGFITFVVSISAVSFGIINLYLIKNMDIFHNAFGWFWASRTLGEVVHNSIHLFYSTTVTLLQPNNIPVPVGIAAYSVGFYFIVESCMMHQCLSFNRFTAVWLPFYCGRIFTKKVCIMAIIFTCVFCFGMAMCYYMNNSHSEETVFIQAFTFNWTIFLHFSNSYALPKKVKLENRRCFRFGLVVANPEVRILKALLPSLSRIINLPLERTLWQLFTFFHVPMRLVELGVGYNRYQRLRSVKCGSPLLYELSRHCYLVCGVLELVFLVALSTIVERENGTYDVFALCEYIDVFLNIAYHGCAFLDIRYKVIFSVRQSK
ncbi:hypothetical protein QR680_015807 [Steinernema hermaphroditum]|uniref:7TM GPCR serpentine receptor class x (Srx) domain-containing protein n=1 Tax=Steinernema hermaphroditum TaxID=289476 RepID=A0AA39HAW1_9BILA|nr:hypothetical protein QR680_015807 [Steinernema hermaphroditum]